MQLLPDQFTEVNITEESLVQFRGGVAECAPSASPGSGDITTHANGSYIITAVSFYARGSGTVSVRPV